ncbi:major capsid protein [Tortoise microvirus 10]|nr:major capsid protein [Tortoise microvirus 10]QCS36997.1 major capsid protein [Tortoise microvirus 10]
MDRRLQAPNSGSNYNFNDKLIRPSVPRSMFDLSHLFSTTIPSVGSIIPIALFETLPGDSFELSVSALLRVLPQVVPMYSRQRLSIHAFYSTFNDLWINSNTFFTRGYTGNTVFNIPSGDALSFNGKLTDTFNLDTSIVPYMIPALESQPVSTWVNARLNLLPLMMYKRIFRDYYMNKNYYINSREWLPDSDDDFRLDNQGHLISFGAGASACLGDLMYRDFPDDYFLSAFPSPQRGTAPTLDFSLDIPDLFRSNFTNNDMPTRPFFEGIDLPSGSTSDMLTLKGDIHGAPFNVNNPDFSTSWQRVGSNAMGFALNAHLFDSAVFSSTITLNQIRELAVAQSVLEKMAKTDGSYGDFGLTFFGIVPRAANVHRPIYIGGTIQPIMFSEVLQTVDTETNPLGSYAGHGISGGSSGYLGSVNCDDYGYIMIVASVIPDVYYSQGIDLLWTKSLQTDMYLPERARLGLRPILNKELYFSNDATVDNDIFAYQSPYEEFRYQNNRIAGKMASPIYTNFWPYTQSRYFTDTPQYSQEFATMKDNVRMTFLAAPTEVPYTAQFSIQCRAVRPLPYRPIPSDLGVSR